MFVPFVFAQVCLCLHPVFIVSVWLNEKGQTIEKRFRSYAVIFSSNEACFWIFSPTVMFNFPFQWNNGGRFSFPI
ncbi:hypothetical protein BCT23_19600 [Enterovibrio norvegicus]|uniref:Uncharacterized protein n=1 Tax=Enterovibrio norvegicus TaxID=188144 RepID=A0A2N7L8E4_9GAMM|nr:hypothetical protein BCT23_19600 [Enterovibrio norvegicus]